MNLEHYIVEYNEVNKKSKLNIIMFNRLVEHCIKICRIMKLPYGNGILIGNAGLGLSEITKLAVFLCNYDIVEIKLVPNYIIEDWYNDLKLFMTKTGIEERQSVFILKYSQILKEEFLSDLDSLINNGEIHGIFNKEEYENIVSQAKAKITSDELKSQINSAFVLSEFFQRVKENLHIFIEMSPSGSNLRERVRTHKSIINCSNVIWVEEWPDSGFKAVAEYHFKNLKMSGYKDAIIDIMITMHHDASLLARTPNVFADFIQNFIKASNEITSKLTELQEKFESGIEKIKKAKELVEDYQAELDVKNPTLREKKKNITYMLEQYRDDASHLEKQRNFLKQEEAELLAEAQEAEAIEKECKEALDKAYPGIQAAIEQLKQLSKLDLSELKTMRKPPKAIRLLMEAVCIVIKEEPTRVKTKDGQSFTDDYWPTATGKRVLGNPKLLEILTKYGVNDDQLDAEAMAKAEEVLQNPDFEYKNIARACLAAKGLYTWIMALREFYYISEEIKPKREAFVMANKQYQQKNEEMKKKKIQLEELENKLLSQKTILEDKESEVRALEDEISKSRIRKDRALELFEGLSGEEQKWVYKNRILARVSFMVI